LRKLFPKPLLLGRPKRFEPSAMKSVLLYQTAEETQVQLSAALQIGRLLVKAFSRDWGHFPS